jgi:predicted Zn-dependent protease
MSKECFVARRRGVAGIPTVLCVALFLFGCATTGINKGQLNIVTTEEEVRMGQELAVEVEKEFTIYRDPAVTAYVQSVGDRVARVSDRTDIEYRFAVIEKDELNAFAMPGGYIYIYTGLMKDLDDEAQLAAVLAHEVGHVTARHATERLTAIYGYQILAGLVLGENPNFWAGLVADVFSTTGMLAYSRQNEYEADRLGTAYAGAAGYDPRGMTDLLGKLAGMQEREPSKLEELLATHPPTSERLSRAESIVAGMRATGGTARNEEAYRKIRESLP